MAAAEQPSQEPESEEPEHSGPCATRSEIVEQLHALANNPEGSTRLLEYAKIQAKKFYGKADDDIAQDLLSEAIHRALSTRHWYPQEIDFETFLKGSIKSIGHGWRKHDKRSEPMPDALASPVNEQAQVERSIMLSQARDCLRGHPYAVEIFDLMREGYKGPEIRERLGLTSQTYEAVYKWISRTWATWKREGYRQ